MKAIFLDIDGVIATPTSVRLNYLLGRGPETQWYDLVSLTYLGRLVSETSAVVVLTSNWRHDLGSSNDLVEAIMTNLYDQLAAAGAPVYDTTPVCYDTDRSGEIAAWLDKHPCEAYAIIDDLARFDDRPDIAEGHLVLIPESDGIRHQHFYQAREILGASWPQNDAPQRLPV